MIFQRKHTTTSHLVQGVLISTCKVTHPFPHPPPHPPQTLTHTHTHIKSPRIELRTSSTNSTTTLSAALSHVVKIEEMLQYCCNIRQAIWQRIAYHGREIDANTYRRPVPFSTCLGLIQNLSRHVNSPCCFQAWTQHHAQHDDLGTQ